MPLLIEKTFRMVVGPILSSSSGLEFQAPITHAESIARVTNALSRVSSNRVLAWAVLHELWTNFNTYDQSYFKNLLQSHRVRYVRTTVLPDKQVIELKMMIQFTEPGVVQMLALEVQIADFHRFI